MDNQELKQTMTESIREMKSKMEEYVSEGNMEGAKRIQETVRIKRDLIQLLNDIEAL